MIRKLKKYLFMGLKQDQEAFFKKMQARGFVEFLAPQTKKVFAVESEASSLIDAIKILRKMPKKEQLKEQTGLTARNIAGTVISAQGSIDRLEEDKKKLESEIQRIAPLGDFSLTKLQEIERETGRITQFFCIKKDKLHQVESIGEYIYINSFFDLDFFMSIAKKKKTPEYMIEVRVQEDLATLKAQKEQTKIELKRNRKILHANATLIEFLADAAIDATNTSSRSSSKDFSVDRLENHLFSIEGWMPAFKAKQIISAFEKMGIIIEEVSITKNERVPTCITNKGVARIGEDLVHIMIHPRLKIKTPPYLYFLPSLFFTLSSYRMQGMDWFTLSLLSFRMENEKEYQALA